MRGGRLRHRITLQSRTTTRDEYGGLQDVWNDVHNSVAASIEPLNGRELIAAQAVQSETTHRVTIRYIPGVTAAMRVNFNGRHLGIVSVLNIGERDRELQLMCSEGKSNG